MIFLFIGLIYVCCCRNASLQLYGAVVPRLVGQCSGRGSGTLDFGNGYSVNHFVTHFPKLKFLIRTQLRKVSEIRGTSNAALRSYSNIVHVLILLSKLSTNGDVFDYPTKEFREEMKYLLCTFLGNPMMHVRQLVAKAYAALTPFNFISLEMKEAKRNALSIYDVNTLHGYLLIHNNFREKLIDTYTVYSPEILKDISAFNLSDLKVKDKNIHLNEYKYTDFIEKFFIKQPCYIPGILFLQQLEISNPRPESTTMFCSYLSVIKDIMSSEKQEKIQPGFFQFVGNWARLYAIDTNCWIPINNSLELNFDRYDYILNSNCPEIPIEFLKRLSHRISLLEFILRYLMLINNKRQNKHQLVLDEIVTFTLKTIKHASLKINWLAIDEIELNELKFDKITEEFNQIEMTIANSYMIPVKNSLILAFSKCETSINKVLSHVLDLCMDEKESVRLRAMEYIEIALHSFVLLNNRNQLMIMRCCLILLKDEIADIRKNVSTFLQKYTSEKDIVHYTLQHEEIVYQQLLSNILHLQFDIAIADNIDFIRYLTCAIKDISSYNDTMIENPFNHDDNIFYKEESKFLNLCFLCNSPSQSCDIRKGNNFDAVQAIQTKCFRKLQEKAGFNYDDLRTILYMKEMDYLTRKRDAVAQQQKQYNFHPFIS